MSVTTRLGTLYTHVRCTHCAVCETMCLFACGHLSVLCGVCCGRCRCTPARTDAALALWQRYTSPTLVDAITPHCTVALQRVFAASVPVRVTAAEALWKDVDNGRFPGVTVDGMQCLALLLVYAAAPPNAATLAAAKDVWAVMDAKGLVVGPEADDRAALNCARAVVAVCRRVAATSRTAGMSSRLPSTACVSLACISRVLGCVSERACHSTTTMAANCSACGVAGVCVLQRSRRRRSPVKCGSSRGRVGLLAVVVTAKATSCTERWALICWRCVLLMILKRATVCGWR